MADFSWLDAFRYRRFAVLIYSSREGIDIVTIGGIVSRERLITSTDKTPHDVLSMVTFYYHLTYMPPVTFYTI